MTGILSNDHGIAVVDHIIQESEEALILR